MNKRLEQPSLQSLQAASPDAWTAFFACTDGTIRSIVSWSRWHFDAHTRQDAIQLIRAGIVQSIGGVRSEQALTAFVRKLCFRRCVDLFRKRYREALRMQPMGRWNDEGEWEDLELASGEENDPAEILMREERALLLREALARLDLPSRDCLLQFYVEGLSYREMAERQGVAVNTIGSRLARCLEKLRKLLARTGAAPEPLPSGHGAGSKPMRRP